MKPAKRKEEKERGRRERGAERGRGGRGNVQRKGGRQEGREEERKGCLDYLLHSRSLLRPQQGTKTLSPECDR